MRLMVVFPTVRLQRAAETAARWKRAGFMPLLMVNEIYGAKYPENCGVIKKSHYEGYFREINLLCHIAFTQARADVVVCAGDGIWPDPDMDGPTAGALFATKFPNGLGVMQPIFDKFPAGEGSCWAPWIGRTFYEQFYEGSGPFSHEYMQYFGGHELFDVTTKEGLLFQADVYHQVNCQNPRDWQGEHNYKEYLDKDQSMYRERKVNKFPGSGMDSRGKLYLPPKVGKIILPSEI